MKKYKINEVFYSLQGEGNNVGSPSVFVRFAHCNLACDFCDTDFNTFTEMTSDEIKTEVAKYPTKRVVFTGGEPMLQLDSFLLYEFTEYFRAVETNGTIRPSEELLDVLNWITVSPKSKQFAMNNGEELKLVVDKDTTEADVQYYERFNFKHYYLQPMSLDGDATENAIRICMARPNWKISIQMHKLLGVE